MELLAYGMDDYANAQLWASGHILTARAAIPVLIAVISRFFDLTPVQCALDHA